MQQLDLEFEVLGAVEDQNALLQAASQMKPDVCVVDISMPIMSGIEAITQMKASGLSVKVVFLTVHEDPDFLEAALATGALGYVVKSRVATDLSRHRSGARQPIVHFAIRTHEGREATWTITDGWQLARLTHVTDLRFEMPNWHLNQIQSARANRGSSPPFTGQRTPALRITL